MKIADSREISPDQFAPLISFVGCPAAYRSGYSKDRHDPLSQLIRLVKKGVDESVIDRLGEILIDFVFSSTNILRTADYVIPVPGSLDRVSSRGYSIPLLLAQKLSRMCALPLHDELVTVTGAAPELRHIPRGQRAQAISGAFQTPKKEDWVQQMSILIIDDIITSGSTINEIAKILSSHDAKQIAAVALAHTE